MKQTIGQRIRLALEINHMRQSDLSKKTGISPSAINQYISGNFEPKQNNIYLLAKALNVNEAWLMGYDVSIERSDNSLPLITEQEVALLKLFRKLSETGREEALKRVEELSALSRYGQRIRLALEINHMRQSDLSKKTGISPSAINQYISGNFEPKQNNIYLLAKALNVNEAWLMGYDVSIERSDNSLPLITEQEVALLKLFRKLSETGREEALKRVEELSALSRYLPK